MRLKGGGKLELYLERRQPERGASERAKKENERATRVHLKLARIDSKLPLITWPAPRAGARKVVTSTCALCKSG